MIKKSVFPVAIAILAVLGIIFIIDSLKDVSENFSSNGTDIRGARQWEYMRLRDPKTGLIPKNIHSVELQFVSSLPGSYKNISNSKYASLLSNKWDMRGPSNIGGRSRAIAKDILDKNTIIAGGVSGGMWRSIDDGQTWKNTTRPDQLHSSTSIAQDRRTGKENIWYYGTGELRGSSAQSSGDGIFKSTDNGNSWNLLPSTSTKKPNSWDNSFDYVWNVVTNHTNLNQDEVLAATAMGAIMRSTDGGGSWNAVLGGLGPDRSYFTDIAISPKGVLFAALSSMIPGNGTSISKGIFRSTDGINWTDITPDNWAPNTWRTVIGISTSDENQVYFLSETPKYGKLTRDLYRDSMFHSLWKYTYLRDEGKGANGIWDDRSQNLPAPPTDWRGQYNSQDSYNMGISVKPDNSNVVFIAGTNLYRSDDGFSTDTKTVWIGGYMQGVVGGYKEYPNHHPDVHTLFFDYTNPNVLYTGTDGGIHKTLDCMQPDLTWISLNNTYLTTQFYSISLNTFDVTDYSVVGGMQDNCSYLTNSFDLKDAWKRLLDSDGFCCITGGKNTYYVSKNSVYQPKIRIYRVRTDDNGNILTSTRIDPSLGKDFIWNTPFTLDPNNARKMYVAGGGVIWRNSDLYSIPVVDSKDSTMIGWDSLQSTVVTNASISALMVSKSPANVLVYGTTKGKLYKVNDCDKASPASVEITGQSFPSGGYISSIAFDPADASRILVSFSNYNVLSIFSTTDGGTNWVHVAGNLEEFPSGSGSGPGVNWIEVLPVGGKNMYFAGTSAGLYATCSLDGPNTVWTQEGAESIGNCIVDMVDVRAEDGYVVVGTHGCGVFSTKITAPYPVPNAPVLVSPITTTRGQLTSVNLVWNAVPTAVYYTVQVATDKDFKNVVWQNDGVATTQISFDEAEQGYKEYFWRVFSKNSGGISVPSEVWTFRTAIGAPTLLYPSDNAENMPLNIGLRWQKVSGAEKYHVLVASSLSFGKKIADTVVVGDSILLLTNLDANKKYYWKVASIDTDSEGILSKANSFKTNALGDVGDNYYSKINESIKNIFPNPCRNNFRLSISPDRIIQTSIRLVSSDGQVRKNLLNQLLFKGDYTFDFDVADISAGKYFVEMISENDVEVKSIVIIR